MKKLRLAGRKDAELVMMVGDKQKAGLQVKQG